MQPNVKRWLWWIAAATNAFLVITVSMIAYVQLAPRNLMKPTVASLDAAPVAMVLGASVKDDGTLSDALKDRILTGVELYQTGKVTQILMTGDDGGLRRNEIVPMKQAALDAGVPEKDILTDGEGYRTYESCKRASQIFDIKKAIVVTQRFHLPRALYLCSRFGIDVQGIAADKQPYVRILYFTMRDLLASAKAWWDINVYAPASPVR